MDAWVPQEALTRIQLEYLEMPGLTLTPPQIGRLCGLPQEICDGALALLLRTGFLRQSSNGTFARPGAAYVRTRKVIV